MPGTGMNLWGAGCKSPVRESGYEFKPLAQIPAEGKGGTYLHNW